MFPPGARAELGEDPVEVKRRPEVQVRDCDAFAFLRVGDEVDDTWRREFADRVARVLLLDQLTRRRASPTHPQPTPRANSIRTILTIRTQVAGAPCLLALAPLAASRTIAPRTAIPSRCPDGRPPKSHEPQTSPESHRAGSSRRLVAGPMAATTALSGATIALFAARAMADPAGSRRRATLLSQSRSCFLGRASVGCLG